MAEWLATLSTTVEAPCELIIEHEAERPTPEQIRALVIATLLQELQKNPDLLADNITMENNPTTEVDDLDLTIPDPDDEDDWDEQDEDDEDAYDTKNTSLHVPGKHIEIYQREDITNIV